MVGRTNGIATDVTDLVADILDGWDAAENAPTDPDALDGFLSNRSVIVCIAFGGVLTSLESNADQRALSQTSQLLAKLQQTLKKAPAILLQRASRTDAVAQSQLRTPPDEAGEELAIWLVPRIIRTISALADCTLDDTASLLEQLRSVLVQTVRALCGTELLSEGGATRAREILLELLRFCAVLCPLSGEPGLPTVLSYALFGRPAGGDSDDDIFDIDVRHISRQIAAADAAQNNASSRPFRLSIPKVAATFLAANLLTACAQVALSPQSPSETVALPSEVASGVVESASRTFSKDIPAASAAHARLALLRSLVQEGSLDVCKASEASWQRLFGSNTVSLSAIFGSSEQTASSREHSVEEAVLLWQTCRSDTLPGKAARPILAQLVCRSKEDISNAAVADDPLNDWPVSRTVATLLLLSTVSLEPAVAAYQLLDAASRASFEGNVIALRSGSTDQLPAQLVEPIKACAVTAPAPTGRKRKRGANAPASSPAPLRPLPPQKEPTWQDRANAILVDKLGQEAMSLPGDLQHVITKLIAAFHEMDDATVQATVEAIGRLACIFAHEGPKCSCYDIGAYEQTSDRLLLASIAEGLLRQLVTLMRSNTVAAATQRMLVIKATTRCLMHTRIPDRSSATKDLPAQAALLLAFEARPERLSSGQLIAAYIRSRQPAGGWDAELPVDVVTILRKLDETAVSGNSSPLPRRDTAGIACATIAKFAIGNLQSRVLLSLVKQFGSQLDAQAHLHLSALVPLRAATQYKLMLPHMRDIGPWLAQQLVREPRSLSMTAINMFADFIKTDIKAFVRGNGVREHILPTIVAAQRRDALVVIAKEVDMDVSTLCADDATPIIVHLLLDVQEPRRKACFDFLQAVVQADLPTILSGNLSKLVAALLVAAGSERLGIGPKVDRAFLEVERLRTTSLKSSADAVVKMLGENVLAILTRMNDELNDHHGKKTAYEKCCIVRGLGTFIEKVGPGIASVSPQIMASLQSTLRSDGLRKATLQTWYTFVSTQKYETIGPLIGSTSAAFVREWPRFGDDERSLAIKCLTYMIKENGVSLRRYIDDIADFGGIVELKEIQDHIKEVRTSQSLPVKLGAAIRRVASENDSIELQGLRDLAVILRKAHKLATFASGDTFSPLMGRLIQALMGSIARDGVGREEVRDLAYRCIGMVGPLDPDRLDIPPEEPPLVVLHNFHDHEENNKFCLHLIKDVLVGVYRSSIDLKHQTALAFAIQELLRFCGLTKEVAAPRNISNLSKQQQVWHELPPAVLETITPLLDSQYMVARNPTHLPSYPIYVKTTTYREWLRGWTLALIERCQTLKHGGKIFGVASSAVKFSDVGVSRHLMPHLVLAAMLSGNDIERENIRAEFVTVLQDQLNPKTSHSAESRSLCAQTVFGLMDHISRFLRLRKVQKPVLKGGKHLHTPQDREVEAENKRATEKVDETMSAVNRDLQARAALESRSYSRSLLNFEEVVRVMDSKPGRDVAKEQQYLELLHQVYAELDEPDGMEGISTRLIEPSIWTQIREHESTGRWTSAQSCWEVQLQSDSNEPKLHVGLLKCLRNLGHYDSMRTHIVGVLQEHPDWRPQLAGFEIESALVFGDWTSLESVLRLPDLHSHEAAFGNVLLTMRDQQAGQVDAALFNARQQIGASVLSAVGVSYPRAYDTFLDLGILHELESIFKAARGDNAATTAMPKLMASRLEASSPAFRVRESLLNMRRAGLRLSSMPGADAFIGPMWLESAKIARKAGHMQTSYSAVLRAAQLNTPATYLQSAQLKHDEGQSQRAIQELATVLDGRLIKQIITDGGNDPALAKASLRSARWKDEAGRFEHNEIATLFQNAAKLKKQWETPYYDLGHYYDELYKRLMPPDNPKAKPSAHDAELAAKLQPLVASNLHSALKYGNKYVFQALPRLVTIWLELGNDAGVQAAEERNQKELRSQQPDLGSSARKMHAIFEQVHGHVHKASKDLPGHQWLTVYPQLVARVMHRLKRCRKLLADLLIKTMARYHHQCLWLIIGGAKSTTRDRQKVCQAVFEQTQTLDQRLQSPINGCIKLADQMLLVCGAPLADGQRDFQLSQNVPGLPRLMPSTMIIPIQSSMVAGVPPKHEDSQNWKPFADELPTFAGVDDKVEVMSSVARPRKVTFNGSDGRRYPFLLKPRDDLRKDARMMDFSAMINKLLKRDTESRRRQLHVRTYGVVPLNETCGIIEWVANVSPLRPTLIQLYEARGLKRWYAEDIKQKMESYRNDPADCGARFKVDLIEKWPGVFHEWFLDTFPEPSAWLRARLAYARTYAVMCMVGFVVGLGDRHCENILFDSNTGEVLHVDLNCLFEAGKGFDISEKVPFRLTTNIVDGLGVTGIEGVFRRACEVAMRILRLNRDSLMSVLEAFVHDPLTEWAGSESDKKKKRSEDSEKVQRAARRALNTIESKLRGTRISHEAIDKPVAHPPEVQVDALIKEAMDLNRLAQIVKGGLSRSRSSRRRLDGIFQRLVERGASEVS